MITLTQAAKAEAISFLESLSKRFLFHGISNADQRIVIEYLAWLRAQPESLNVNAKLESFPSTRSAAWTLTVSLDPIGHQRTLVDQQQG